MVYVTPKDHRSETYRTRLTFTHPYSRASTQILLSTQAQGGTASSPEVKPTHEFRMICIGSWDDMKDSEAEAYRLFLKYALHQQNKK